MIVASIIIELEKDQAASFFFGVRISRPQVDLTFERFRFLAPCQRLRVIVCVLSAHLRDDESSTCVCLRLREQCLRSEITSVSRVAHVLLLRFVAGNMDVNRPTPASKTFPVDRKHSDCSKALRNPQNIDLCVLASFSCRVYAETQGRQDRPVAKGTILGRFQLYILGGYDGDCSLVRRLYSPKVRKSEIKVSSFRRFVSPKVKMR